MMDLNKVLQEFPCEDCGLRFSDYKQFLWHRKYHISLLHNVVTEEILLEESCPLCLKKYCEKYKEICLENLLGSGKTFTGSEQGTKAKQVKRCKYYPECHAEFSTAETFASHLKEVHNDNKAYACQQWAYATPVYWQSEQHLRIHLGCKIFKCPQCPTEYGSAMGLHTHLVLVHKDVSIKSYDCPHCGKKFAHRRGLRRHIRLHRNSESFKCHVCPKEFSHKTTLVEHLKRHDNSEGYICDTCSKTFISKKTLRQHLMTHTGKKLFSCEYCDKKFYRISCRARHRAIHVDTDPVKCEICGKSYTGKYRLRKHMKTHSSQDNKNLIKPYDCQHCGKRFTRKRSIKLHLDPKKESKDILHCKDCSKTFNNMNCLTHHEHSHMEGFLCEVCKVKCFSRGGFVNHLARHGIKQGRNRTKLASKKE